MYLLFVNKCLMKRKADFFDPIKKVNLDIGLKKMKNIWKIVSAMTKAFGAMLGARTEPRRSVSVRCYISVIELSISRFDS